MTLNKNSWLVQFTYLFRKYGSSIPPQTNLCRFFWRFVFNLLFWIMILAMVVVLIGVISANWKIFLIVTGGVIGVLAIFVGLYWVFAWFLDWKDMHRNDGPEWYQVIKAFIKAKKDKVCPTITLEE